MPQLLDNVILSLNPCPQCIDAAGAGSMTYQEWGSSSYGLPGSSGRYCEDDCHCILLPVAMKKEFPEIGKRILLRGDKDSGIPRVVVIGEGEMELIALMERWNAEIGVLPKDIYRMTVLDALAFLKAAIKAKL